MWSDVDQQLFVFCEYIVENKRVSLCTSFSPWPYNSDKNLPVMTLGSGQRIWSRFPYFFKDEKDFVFISCLKFRTMYWAFIFSKNYFQPLQIYWAVWITCMKKFAVTYPEKLLHYWDDPVLKIYRATRAYIDDAYMHWSSRVFIESMVSPL